MIACFPDAYPDELLYSLCARYTDRMQYPAKSALLRELFGTTSFACTIEVPTRLSWLSTQLPAEQGYTFDTLIDCHTLLPLYAPFLAPERLHHVRTSMGGGAHTARLAGVGDGSITPRSQLRFCPVCVTEDRVQFGEAYWHRVHQAPGVEVCPKHAIFVQVCSMIARSIHAYQHYFSIEALLPANASLVVQPIDRTNATHLLLFALAQDIAWLLTHPHTALDAETIQAQYLNLLKNQGFAQGIGRIHQQALFTAFAATYTAELLTRLQVPLAESASSSWPVVLVKKDQGGHPLCHLLMMHFLGHTIESFSQLPIREGHTVESFPQLPTREEPFGQGPWPCLNPICEHYHQRSIPACQISYQSRWARKLVGKFACACGFVYSRRGPDRDPTDQFRRTSVITVGPVWEALLTELWPDAAYTLTGIARLLGTRPLRVVHVAQRLNLPFPRPGGSSQPPTVSTPMQAKRGSVS